jgi:sporulation protein YabP
MTVRTENEIHTEGSQRLILSGRQSLSVSGVIDVHSFDESGAVLKTELGTLMIDGEELHVTKLDIANGNVDLDGKINGMFFSDGRDQKGRKRIFK